MTNTNELPGQCVDEHTPVPSTLNLGLWSSSHTNLNFVLGYRNRKNCFIWPPWSLQKLDNQTWAQQFSGWRWGGRRGRNSCAGCVQCAKLGRGQEEERGACILECGLAAGRFQEVFRLFMPGRIGSLCFFRVWKTNWCSQAVYWVENFLDE